MIAGDKMSNNNNTAGNMVVNIAQVDTAKLKIVFDDGFENTLFVRDIRLKCPCAQCVDEMTGKILLVSKQVPLDIYPQQITPIGNYALRFEWSDGHSTGLFTYKLLREIAEDKNSDR